MTKLSVIWSVIAAVFVGGAALTTGYIYKDRDRKTAEAPDTTAEKQVEQATTESASEPSGTGPVAADEGSGQTETDVVIADEQLTFDVVGVEPTGETVVAGRSDAGSIVALTANGKVVGKGIANEKGEWTIILEKPLEPGDYDVGLQTHDEAGEKTHESTQRLAVSVPEDRKSQPLVVLNKPDAPSDVLQMPAPATGPATEETVVAAAPSAAEPAAPAETAEPKSAPENQVAATPAEPAPAETQTETAAPAVAETPAAAPAETETAATPTETPKQDKTVVAAAEPTAPPAEQPQSSAPAAGSETQSEERAPAASAPSEAQTDTDTANASVPVPAAKQPEAKAPETEVAAVAPAAKPETTETAQPAVPQVTVTASGSGTNAEPGTARSAVSVEAVESERGKLYVAGTGAKGKVVRVYVGDEYVGDVRVGQNGRWLLQVPKDLKPGTVDIRADLVGDEQGTVLARAAVAFEKADEQIVLTKVVASGETASDNGAAPGTVVQALPNVIIRKGDNLWTISRRLYGEGLRYTTIYQANKGQIRNPDLIYPGQVFLTPQGDLNWKPETN
jgi:nucleoid-associated protein YgaU